MTEGKIYLSIEENSIVPSAQNGAAYYSTKSSPATNLKNGNSLSAGWVNAWCNRELWLLINLFVQRRLFASVQWINYDELPKADGTCDKGSKWYRFNKETNGKWFIVSMNRQSIKFFVNRRPSSVICFSALQSTLSSSKSHIRYPKDGLEDLKRS